MTDELRRAVLKRATDICVASVALLVTAPAIVATAILSTVVYRANPIFVQTRVGRNGRAFRIVKIRTLPPSTGAYVDKHALSGIPNTMTAVRRAHLDELPQFWNVLIGQMSLVGPRPEMQFLHDRLDHEFADERTSVNPGLTGLWQVSPHHVQLIGSRTEYDRLYVRHWTLLLDLWLLRATVSKVLFGSTVALHEVPQRTFQHTRHSGAECPLAREEVRSLVLQDA